jgi:hypothetical protein
MWWKLAALAAGTAVLLLLLFAPIVSVKVKVPLPHGADPTRFAAQVNSGAELTNMIVGPLIIVVILCGAAWLGWRIIRRSRHQL